MFYLEIQEVRIRVLLKCCPFNNVFFFHFAVYFLIKMSVLADFPYCRNAKGLCFLLRALEAQSVTVCIHLCYYNFMHGISLN